MTYQEAAQILDHPRDHWDAFHKEFDEEFSLALDMAAGLLEAAGKEQANELQHQPDKDEICNS
jgi:hypothetical protein